MLIQFQFEALRKIKWNELATRFLFGGAITAAAGLVAQHFGPAVGGLFLAFPAIFPASVTLLAKKQAEKKAADGMDGTIRGRKAAALESRGTLRLVQSALSVLPWPSGNCRSVGIRQWSCWFPSRFGSRFPSFYGLSVGGSGIYGTDGIVLLEPRGAIRFLAIRGLCLSIPACLPFLTRPRQRRLAPPPL